MKINLIRVFIILSFIFIGIISVNIVSITAQGGRTSVLYISRESGGKTLEGLSLDSGSIEVTTQTIARLSFLNLDNFDVVVLNDANLTQSQLNTITDWVQIKGHGLIVIMGPTLTKGNTILSRFKFTIDSSF